MDAVDEVTEASDLIQTLVAGGLPQQAACQQLLKYGVSKEVVAAAEARYEQSVGIIGRLREPVAVVTPGSRDKSWYGGPTSLSRYWPEFRGNVQDSLPLEVAVSAVSDIDDATSRILDLAGAPGRPEIKTKGMVLGYVQSGKTTNFMGVMSKAADVGYRLFIVLSGITDNLRSQTQERIEEVLVGGHPERWHLLTDLDRDFWMTGNAANLLNDPNQRLIAVVKKNPFRLRRLNNWIKSAGPEVIKGVPLMVIDDEADQASLNVGSGSRVSRINGLIGQIIDHPKVAYIAYTATPFANLLTNPSRYENLYPDDYIVEMKQPEGYFGPERLFGRDRLSPDEPSRLSAGLDVINIIDAAEAELAMPPKGVGAVHDWEPSVTPALADALDWFVLATAARRVRSGELNDSTMLIHTSMRAEAHARLAEPVREYLSALGAKFEIDPDLRGRLHTAWLEESAAVPALSVGASPVDWTAIEGVIPDVLNAARVIVDNYTSTDRLYYRKDQPATVVVIGGNTLSRGLTLEGLVSSFFVRAASAYDTLLQMGRWFGYRRGYEDLPRIWMTEELAEWFQDLATVEEEIRREIRSYPPDITPREVGIRIRCHPSMTITSAAKMRGAVDAFIDYSGKREQTITFEHKDLAWLGNNIAATRSLLLDTISTCEFRDDERAGRLVVRGVPSARLLQFLGEYRMHPNARRLRADLLAGYIEKQLDQGALQTWNLVVFENPDREPDPRFDLGVGRPVRLIQRSRLKRFGAYANIKSLVSTIDRIADIAEARSDLGAGTKPEDDASLALYRQDIVGDVGLLCIYPIDKNSTPRPASDLNEQVKEKEEPRDPRAPLEAVEHVIGLALYFPRGNGESGYKYKTANIIEPVEDDSEEFDAMERADVEAAMAEEAV